MKKLFVKVSIVVSIGLYFAGHALASDLPAIKPAPPVIVKFTPGMTMQSLATRLDTDFVQLSNGRVVSVKALRTLSSLQKTIRAAVPGSKLPAELKAKPVAKGRILKTNADLQAALKGPDNETIQLPSGRLATVGQIKFLLPHVERRLGKKVAMSSDRPNLIGEPVRIRGNETRAEWSIILKKPDSTILESLRGTRITVGELKKVMTQGRPVSPAKTQSAPTQGKR